MKLKSSLLPLAIIFIMARIRNRDVQEWQKHNIVITTYGTLRSDVKLFMSCTI